MKYTRIIIIYNPKSTGDSKRLAQQLKSDLRKRVSGVEVILEPTQYAGHAETLAREAAQRYKRPLIISSSGDGGYNEVVNGVMQANNAQAVCAVLPAGNANDHSRTLQSAPLADLITAGKISRIDVLRMSVDNADGTSTTRFAHSYIGLGLTPVIADELNRHTLNAFREIKIVLQRFYKYRPFEIRRGTRTLQLNSLLFANINQMAKVLTLSQENQPADGKFEVVSFPADKKRKLIGCLLRATVSSLQTTRREKSYAFQVVKRLPVQLDGEVMNLSAGSRVEITSVHRALRTLI